MTRCHGADFDIVSVFKKVTLPIQLNWYILHTKISALLELNKSGNGISNHRELLKLILSISIVYKTLTVMCNLIVH